MTMMDTNDSRFPKALAIAADAGQWAKCRTADGRKLYAIPSQRDPNVRYLTDATRCTCVDFKRRGDACKHVRAVQIHCALVRAEQRQPKRRQPPEHPVLDMVREPDGSIRWERHDHRNGKITYLPRQAQAYDAIFSKFEGE